MAEHRRGCNRYADNVGRQCRLGRALAGLDQDAELPASRSSAQNLITMPDGSSFDSSSLTDDDWLTAVDQLIATDLSRTIEMSSTETVYSFQVPVDAKVVSGGTFTFVVAVPKSGAPTARLGGGSDAYGPYILLNNFDQNLVISGGAAAVTAGLCAIPAIGWISCAAITTAIVVAGTWLAINGTCPQNLKAYVGVPERNRCVSY